MIDALLSAAQQFFTTDGFLSMALGIGFGLAVGIMPGIGGAAATALLIPATYSMSPETAIIFLMAVATTSGLGGQVTSILVSVPGDPPNAATVLDGYPMTRSGRAAEALGAATFASVFGALFGVVALLLVLPLARALVLSFSYEETFMVMLTGLVLIASLTRGSTFKGLIAAGVGLMISFVGLNPVTGRPRFEFDLLYLYDGLPIVAVLVGLFAGPEMAELFSSRFQATMRSTIGDVRKSRILDGLFATARSWRIVLLGSGVGFLIGLVPGLGGTVAAFVAYAQSKRISRQATDYGKGAVDGVIASESANDADKAGNLLVTVVFGIPGGVVMAILMTGLLLHGVRMGPAMFASDPQIVYLLVVALVIPRVVAAAVVVALGGTLSALARARGDIIAPVIIALAMVSLYANQNEILDVVVALVFAFVGHAMVSHGFSRVALVIALVLGGPMELAFVQAVQSHTITGFVTRPIALVLLCVATATLLVPLVRPAIERMRPRRNS